MLHRGAFLSGALSRADKRWAQLTILLQGHQETRRTDPSFPTRDRKLKDLQSETGDADALEDGAEREEKRDGAEERMIKKGRTEATAL